jgi:hypothetical protein
MSPAHKVASVLLVLCALMLLTIIYAKLSHSDDCRKIEDWMKITETISRRDFQYYQANCMPEVDYD